MTKNKQAILIMAHNNLWTLEKILGLLDYEYFDIFVHIDKKSNIKVEDVENIGMEKSNVSISKKIDVRWADISQIECMLFLIKQALMSNNYKYLHFISGGDMPIKKAEEIFDFFDNSDKEFVQGNPIGEEKFDRINNYNILTKYRRTSKIALIINRLFVSFQKIFRINRNLDIDYVKTGSNWFSITNELAQYVIEKEESILTDYKYTISGDEMFLQTLIYHSKFNEKLCSPFPNGVWHSMRLIDWRRGTPYTFRIDDYQEIMDSECMFARKFDENVDKQIIERIYETLK